MFPSQNTQVVAAGLGQFTSRYSPANAPNLRALASVYLSGVQELENVIWATLEGRFLANAVGIDLDFLGDLVGQARTGLDDPTYRSAIRLRIKANRSQGRSEDIIKIAIIAANNLTSDSNGLVTYTEGGIMAWDVAVTNLLYPAVLQSILQEARAATSRGRLIYSVAPAASMDVFSDTYSSGVGSGVFASSYGGTASTLQYGVLSL